MSETGHPLAERYLEALYELPDSLRVRRELEDQLAATLTGGNHVCIRGFWRIGKTTLMKGTLQRAAERTGGAGFSIDLRDPDRDDGLPQSAEAVLGRVTAKVQEFLNRVGATELKADPARPLLVLGELAAPIFVGLDELIALHALGLEKAAGVIAALLETPKNVKVVMVCHRHRDVDALFESLILPVAASVFVPCVSDEELVQLVQTPAQAEGITFENEALGVLADVTGNRPWELFTLLHLIAVRLKPDFKGTIGPSQVEEVITLDVLAETEDGQKLVDNCLRILLTAMTPDERTVMELLSAGKEGEATEEALKRLETTGWIIAADDGYLVNGALMDGITRSVVEGEIKVSVA